MDCVHARLACAACLRRCLGQQLPNVHLIMSMQPPELNTPVADIPQDVGASASSDVAGSHGAEASRVAK